VVAQGFHSDFKAVPQRFFRGCVGISQRFQSILAMIAQDYKVFEHQFYSAFERVAQ
jgi:hypothetical protein